MTMDNERAARSEFNHACFVDLVRARAEKIYVLYHFGGLPKNNKLCGMGILDRKKGTHKL